MADVELLPLPEGYDKYDPPLLYEGQMFHEGQMRAYARANVARAVEPLQAEIDALRTRLEDTVRDSTNKIEALRAEVAAWRELSDHVRVGACAAIWPDRYTDARTRDVAAALKRAERMAEALALLPDEIVMVEHNPYEGPLMFCCGQRVTSGGLPDLLTNHSKECWYARMRALRDHDQENKA